MKLKMPEKLASAIIRRALIHNPNIIIGGEHHPYLIRWYMIPRNKWLNIYAHLFCRSDDDAALHDHPWSFNISILLKGTYCEMMPMFKKLWPKDRSTICRRRYAGDVVFRNGKAPHRVMLDEDPVTGALDPVWTLFITGPTVREWGFYCEQGWRHWKQFTAFKNTGDSSRPGAGCE